MRNRFYLFLLHFHVLTPRGFVEAPKRSAPRRGNVRGDSLGLGGAARGSARGSGVRRLCHGQELTHSSCRAATGTEPDRGAAVLCCAGLSGLKRLLRAYQIKRLCVKAA
jgi:hypothetical protein